MSTVTNPSTIPFPSKNPMLDETVDINAVGIWGHPSYQPGGACAYLNNGPHVVVRRRVGYSVKHLIRPVSQGDGQIGFQAPLSYGVVGLNNHWLTYPADAGEGDLAVHIRVRKSQHDRRESVKQWLKAADELGPGIIEDFFLTEAYLQAPGSGVQPAAQESETSATWTGKVIAFDSATSSIMRRGDEIGGDAALTVNFGDSPTVDVSLTDLRSTRTLDNAPEVPEPNGGASPFRYPNQTWTGLALAGGAFTDTSGGRSITGVFRNQGPSTGTNANTAGAIFDVSGTMKGGFVATIVPPSPF